MYTELGIVKDIQIYKDNGFIVITSQKPFPIKFEGKINPSLILKVPKREIFVTELIILSHPIWIGDMRNEPKNRFV